MTEKDERPTLSDELFGAKGGAGGREPPTPQGPPSWPDFLGPRPGRREMVLAGVGALLFALIDLIVMWAPMRDRDLSSSAQAVVLVVVAFGFGTVLVKLIGGAFRPIGFGMMLGWVALTLFSLGFATGLN
ncbi:hypothetical protein LO762_25645 [Actinocorallia sp. API 0066]|uniref:hypothetical protein n=1 Tax=Actinocorallia sp. API 0066 TaxID=2896846 RepID=UPI001E300769|nr:hypothetical protein [Actinocorallia sp. API 0066]MCD0452543.1 hypothetical protein [Actinocorallia sp. API 0066]